jgi:hypothetical protein
MSDAKIGSYVKRSDMYFHQPRYRDYRWLETNWFSWLIPEEGIRCHIRSAFRTNLNVVETMVFAFNDPDPHAKSANVLYIDNRHHNPMPVTNLDSYDTVSGLSVRMTVPMQEWTLRYEGLADTHFDLHFRGMMPPVHVAETGTDAEAQATIRHGHLDQTMHCTGEVRIRGKDYSVDFPASRDHSWSPRPESSSGYGFPMSGNFDFGSFGDKGQDFTFFVQTNNDWSDLRKGHVHNGYIIDNGELLGLKEGEGRYTYGTDGWYMRELTYELVDERGRTHVIHGTPKTYYAPGSGYLSLTEYKTRDGLVGYGETNWHADLYELQKISTPPQ